MGKFWGALMKHHLLSPEITQQMLTDHFILMQPTIVYVVAEVRPLTLFHEGAVILAVKISSQTSQICNTLEIPDVAKLVQTYRHELVLLKVHIQLLWLY